MAAGETKEIILEISEQAFTVINEEGKRIKETDTFDLYVGMSSVDRTCAIKVIK